VLFGNLNYNSKRRAWSWRTPSAYQVTYFHLAPLVCSCE
jgi:hypothetical protein